MVITNLNIDTELVSDAQKYGGMHNRIVGVFWSCKYATKGKWVNRSKTQGRYIDNAIWIQHILEDDNAKWINALQNASNGMKEAVKAGGWTS